MYVILSRESSEYIVKVVYQLWSLDVAFHDFAFFTDTLSGVLEQAIKKSILLANFRDARKRIFWYLWSVILYFFRPWTVPDIPLYDPRIWKVQHQE